MIKVYERVAVGSEAYCRTGNHDISVVHACKSPCHQRAVGYRGSLLKTHPNYLSLVTGNNLFLNIIDPPKPLFPDELFKVFLNFSRNQWNSGATILIHCNQGESRAPSLALVFLAKHIKAISNESYDAACADFTKLFPSYTPGTGIQLYLTSRWSMLDAF